MDPWLSTGVGLVASLFGGAVGGLLTAGVIARSSERARARFEAEGVIFAVVKGYAAVIAYEHDQLYEKSAFSHEYGSVAGQEEFARAVLVELPRLPKRRATKIESELAGLVGALTYALAVQRTYIDPEHFDEKRESMRRALTLRKFLFDEGTLDALLPRMLKNQNDIDQHNLDYANAQGAMSRILLEVKR